jgi:cytochrome c oxidase cbb3-type subunit III
MRQRGLLLLAVVSAACVLCACEREARRFTTPAPNSTGAETGQRMSSNQPGAPLGGGVQQPLHNVSPFDGNAFAVNQGKRLFRWYNCNGCHANGGGGIGPPLMDAEWRYGSDPASIFTTIMQGRPQGMPSFGGHIPEEQAWQIVAYVRSMTGSLRKDVAPSRADSLSTNQPENARPREKPHQEKPPAPTPEGAR